MPNDLISFRVFFSFFLRSLGINIFLRRSNYVFFFVALLSLASLHPKNFQQIISHLHKDLKARVNQTKKK